MADETTNSDVSNDKLSYISSLNADAPSFEASNSSEHIEETQPRRLSTEENNNNHSHIQSIQNGEHHQNSSNIQEVESNENHSTESTFIEQTTSNSDQQINDQNSVQNNESSSEQLNNSNHQDQSNTTHNEDHSNALSVDHETSNVDTSLQTPLEFDDKPEEFRAQRELDENEIPPAELPVDQTPIHEETKDSSTESETVITDERPLTELETPYEHHHQENENSFVESGEDEISINNRTNVNDNYPITLASFLHDVVTETFEQNEDDLIPPSIESEKVSVDENLVQTPADFTEEDFPPLPPPTILPQVKVDDENFPPLPSVTTTHEQALNNEQEKVASLSNNESILSPSVDVLGNKTLFKQTIVEGELNSRPTRSTMVTISYRLSFVDSLTSNTRLIESVSNERFFVSENDLIPAIDICVLLMDRGERALIDSDVRHCYGEIGCEDKHIPPITSLNPYRMSIELELHDWISPADVQTLSVDQGLHWGDKKRHMGNFYYRRQDYQTSLQCYRGALRFLDTDSNPLLISSDQSQKSILNDRYIQVQNNVAQVNLLLNKYEPCLNAVDNVLKHDPRNVKALFRKGKALFELGNYDQAIQALKLFTQIQKGSSAAGADNDKANEMITVCENKLANYQKSEKEIYRRMFQPTTTTTTNTAVNQQGQTKNNNQIDQANNNWWLYVALGSAVLATVGLVTFMKYRKLS